MAMSNLFLSLIVQLDGGIFSHTFKYDLVPLVGVDEEKKVFSLLTLIVRSIWN